MTEQVEGQAPAEKVQKLPQESATETSATDTETPSTETTDETKTEEPEKKETRKPWFQDRIDQLTREKWDTRRENETLKQKLAAAQPAETGITDIDSQVMQRAQQLRELERFTDKCNATYTQGVAKHGDFQDAVRSFDALGGLGDKRDFLETINELPNGSDVLYALGKNLDDAHRVLSLSPTRMVLELTKISASLAKPKPVSKAPAPVSPVGASAKVMDGYRPEMTMAEYAELRKKQRK